MNDKIKPGATRLPIKSNCVQQAFDFLNEMIWQTSDERLKELYHEIGAENLELTLSGSNGVCQIRVKMWATDPPAVKDHMLDSEDSFWITFRERLDEVLPTPVENLRCILIE